MANKKKNSGESKADEIKEKLSEGVEVVKEKFEDCKEKVSDGVEAMKEKASEVVEAVKGETEEEDVGQRGMLVTFALLGAWGSGYLAHKVPRADPTAAVVLGGENSFLGLLS